MIYREHIVFGVFVTLICLLSNQAEAGVILYDQNFENPNGFASDATDVDSNTVNNLFSNQPAGFTFAQLFTVETLLVTGTGAFGTGYSDPQGIGGDYVIGMLNSAQPDLLGLSFNVQGNNFLNFRLNVSSIDLSGNGGPFNFPGAGNTPTFEINLYDNPGGLTSLSGDGTLLATSRITGAAAPSRSEFNWTEHTAALDASNATNGNVTVRIDLIGDQGTGYAALDNFLIVASNTPGDVGQPGNGAVPEPTSMSIFGLVFAAGLASRSRVRIK